MIHVFLKVNGSGFMPYSFMILPVLIALIFVEIFLLGKREGKYVENVSMLAAVFALILAVISLQQIASYPVLNFFVGGWKPPYGIQIAVFFMNLILIVMAAFCFFVMTLASRFEKIQMHAYPLFLFLFIGAFGVLHSADIFNIFVYLEMMSIASYALSAISNSAERWRPAFNYMIAGAMMTSFFLLGVVLLYGVYGTLNLYDLHARIADIGIPLIGVFAIVLMISSMLFKSAVFPFYFWKPGVIRNTNPAMTIFFGVFSPLVTFFVAARLVEVFGMGVLHSFMFVAGMITMAVSLFLALYSSHLMNVLAYASIFQTGLLFAAYGLGYWYPLMKTYSIAHMLAMFLFELLIFASLALRRAIGVSFTEKFFVLGLMGSVGMPLTAGFIPKILVFVSAFSINYLVAFFFLFFFVFSVAYSLKAYTLYSEHHFMPAYIHASSTTAFITLVLVVAALIFLGTYPDAILYIARLAIFSLQNFGV